MFDFPFCFQKSFRGNRNKIRCSLPRDKVSSRFFLFRLYAHWKSRMREMFHSITLMWIPFNPLSFQICWNFSQRNFSFPSASYGTNFIMKETWWWQWMRQELRWGSELMIRGAVQRKRQFGQECCRTLRRRRLKRNGKAQKLNSIQDFAKISFDLNKKLSAFKVYCPAVHLNA